MYNNSIINQIPPVTKNIIIVNVIIFLAMTIFPNEIGVMLNRYCGLHYFFANDFIATQFISYQFIHGGFSHLFFNMFSLFIFGMIIESIFGAKRFLIYYLTCGIGAGIIQQIAYYVDIQLLLQENVTRIMSQAPSLTPSEIIPQLLNDPTYDIFLNRLTTVGASGSIYGILLAFALFFPNRPMYIMFIPVPIKAKWVIAGYVVIDLFLGISNFNTGIAHFAHVGGMVFGFLLLLYWRKKGIIRRNGEYY